MWRQRHNRANSLIPPPEQEGQIRRDNVNQNPWATLKEEVLPFFSPSLLLALDAARGTGVMSIAQRIAAREKFP
jgi:hypothetical protein